MSSETMPKKIAQRQRTRKRQPLEVLQGGSPKKVAIEQHPPASFPPASPAPPCRVSTPLKIPTQLSLHPKLTSTVTFSPRLLAESRRSLSMASQRYTFRPETHVQTAPTLSRRVLDYELASEQDLASSQPVSLIQLCTKANYSRNNRARNPRVLHQNVADDMTDIAVTVHSVDNQPQFSRRPVPSYSVTEGYGMTDDNGHLTSPPRFISRDYSWPREESRTQSAQEQTCQPALSDYHTQTNPLNYANHYPSQSRESSYISESPFLRKSDPSGPDRGTWPGDMTPVIQRAPVDATQSTAYAQKAHQKEYMSAAPLQLYRDSFDRPHDRSPYESYRLKHRNNRTDLPEITSGLQYGVPSIMDYGHSGGYTTIRSEPTFTSTYREPPRGENQTSHGSQEASTRTSTLISGTDLTQRVLKEEIYAILDNMHLNPVAESKTTSIPHGSDTTESESNASDVEELLEFRLNAAPLLSNKAIRDEIDAERREPASQCSDLGKELPEAQLPKAQPEAKGMFSEPSRSYFEGERHSEHDNGRCLADAETLAAKIIKPPPGLGGPDFKPPPGLSGPDFHGAPKTFASPANASSIQARLMNTDAWFHTDGRGEEALRRLIANIADNHVESNERLGRQLYSERDRTTVKQTILVIGAALANLHSYNPKERQGHKNYFADFKDVASHCYASPHGGQRSYFEDYPTVDPWKQDMEETAMMCDID
ncbi:hypothetical protein BDV12DRAFT_143084 [Aspergillus spectabilis]